MMPRLLVTGGAGYIGSHFCLLASELGHEVVIVDNLSTGHRQLARFGRLHKIDLRETDKLTAVLKSENVSAVVHFAAFSQVAESMAAPLKYFDNNVGGTVSLLKAMTATGVDRLVFSSSAAVYGDPGRGMIAETAPLNPMNPYGMSKKFCEEIVRETHRSHGLRAAVLRYFNVIGQDPLGRTFEWHEPETHLVPNIVHTPQFHLFGTQHPTPDGTCVRDYVDVNDLVRAHLKALEHLDHLPYFVSNVGRGEGASVRQVLEVCADVLGVRPQVVEHDPRPGDPASLVADATFFKSWCDLELKSLRESLHTLRPPVL